MERDIDLILQATVQTSKQCSATTKIDAVLHNIGIKFGRRILQSRQNGILYLSNRLVKTMCNLLITNRNLHRKSRNTVRSMHDVILGSFFSKISQRRSHMYLDTFGHSLTHLHIMLTTHILLNISCKIIAGNTNRIIGNASTQRDYSNLGTSTADIDYHITLRSLNIYADTNSCSHWFKNQINVATVGVFGRITHGTKLYFSTSRWHSDDHSQRRRKQTTPGVYHSDQSAHHLFARRKVSYHSVAQRTDRSDVVVSLLIHHLCLLPDSDHLVRTAIKGYDRRLIHHDFIIADDDGISRSEVHCNFLNKRKKSHFLVF